MRLFWGLSWHLPRQPPLGQPLSSRFALHGLRAFKGVRSLMTSAFRPIHSCFFLCTAGHSRLSARPWAFLLVDMCALCFPEPLPSLSISLSLYISLYLFLFFLSLVSFHFFLSVSLSLSLSISLSLSLFLSLSISLNLCTSHTLTLSQHLVLPPCVLPQAPAPRSLQHLRPCRCSSHGTTGSRPSGRQMLRAISGTSGERAEKTSWRLHWRQNWQPNGTLKP